MARSAKKGPFVDESLVKKVQKLKESGKRDAIKMANMTPYGLASSLFTRDINVAHRVAGAVRAGTVSVNCYSEGDISAPFGGYKSSGFGGRDKGIEAFNQYTEIKTTWLSLNGRG